MVVKVTSYTRIRKAIKATIRYIMHRPDMEGERAHRTLFGADGPMEKYHGYRMVDAAKKGTVFYRTAISPDPRMDINQDLGLWKLTQVAMAYLSEKLGKDIQFFAAAHEDQSPVRHVNAVVLVPGRLTREEFRKLPKLIRQAAWAEAKLQRRMLDPQPEPEEERRRFLATAKVKPLVMERHERGGARVSKTPRPSCPDCGPYRVMWRIDDDLYKCPLCGAKYEQSYGEGIRREEAELSL